MLLPASDQQANPTTGCSCGASSLVCVAAGDSSSSRLRLCRRFLAAAVFRLSVMGSARLDTRSVVGGRMLQCESALVNRALRMLVAIPHSTVSSCDVNHNTS